MHSTSPVGGKLFALFCLASFLLSLSYGSTFLLSLLIHSRGGNEHDAGSVISTAMLSTFVAVVLSGRDDPAEREDLLRLGARRVFCKPVEIEDLRAFLGCSGGESFTGKTAAYHASAAAAALKAADGAGS